MRDNVEINFCQMNELLISLRAYLSKKSHKGLELGQSWVKQVRKQLSPTFVMELGSDKAKCLEYPIELLLPECPSQRSPIEFLSWLESLPLVELYERTAPWTELGWKPIRDLEEWRSQTIHLLSLWNEQYFQYLDKEILTGLKQDAQEKLRLKVHLAPQEVVEKVTNGLRLESLEGLKKVLLIPQYHFRPWIRYFRTKDQHIYFYPSDALQSLPDEPSPSLLRLTRSLSDENRLRILRFLGQGEKTFTDVAKFISLAKSTVHHHMVVLRASGLVRIHITQKKGGERYSLREGALDELSSQLNIYLKK